MARRPDVEISCHGKKRPAEHDPDDQPLTKKFGRLQIDPVTNHNALEEQNGLIPHGHSSSLTDAMLLDDTKHTTYIHDLNREIAGVEAQELYVSFLPGISEKLTPIPRSILAGHKSQNNELVLYREPTSLTVPKEHDSVRRAIIESRKRARAKQSQHQKFLPDIQGPTGYSNWDKSDSVDAMDIDIDS